jgi:hypothetical protein
MAFGSSSYGSTAYAGSAGSPNPTAVPSVQALNLTLHAPTILIEHEPGTFALNLSGLSVHVPTVIITATPTVQGLTATVNTPTPGILTEPGTFALNLSGLSVHVPTIVITSNPGKLNLGVYADFHPAHGSLAPQIVKFVKDPVVSGGCAQCGTLLWATHERAQPIDSQRVAVGRNKDQNDGVPDDRFLRCARCGWINNMNRAVSHREGSKSGWGITFPEFEIDPDDPLSNQTPNNLWQNRSDPHYPGLNDDSTP